MTLVVAVEDADGSVLLAADSSVSRGYLTDVLRPGSGKIARIGAVGLAYTGSVGAYQIAMAGMKPPRKKRGEAPEAFLRRGVVTPLREALSRAGLLPRATSTGDDGPLSMVLAYAGRAYSLDSSFALYSTPRGYAAAGVAEDIALGVLEHTAGQPARTRIDAAFAAACALSTAVRPPIVVEVVR